jgi:hypothetical protein
VRTILLIFGSVGLIIPLAIMLFFSRAIPSWTTFLWPSSIFLGATIEREWAFSSIVIIGISIAVNVILYVLIAFLLQGMWFLITRFK